MPSNTSSPIDSPHQGPKDNQDRKPFPFDCVMDTVFDVVLISDPQGMLAYANRSASQKFGYTRDELLQMQLFELAAPDSHEVLKGILATGSSSSGAGCVSHWLHKDGRVLSLEVKGNLYLCNAIKHFVIVARDLSPSMESGRPETPTPKFLETILHHAPTPVFVNSVEGRYHLVNPAWEQATGKPARDVIGRSSQELFSPDTARFFQQVVRQVAGTGETVAFQEAPMIRGEQKHYHTVSFPIRDHEGKVMAVGGVSLDITDLKLIQATLKEHVAALHALCRHHPESFFLVDGQGKVLEASQVAAHRLGLTPAELVGTCAYDYFSPEVSQFRRELINQVMATGQARSFSERREHYWFDTHFIPLKDGTGKVTKVMVLAMDITARRLAELALRESENRFRTIFDNATDGILLAEIETKKFYLSNPMMALMLGYTQEEMQHLGVTDIHPAESLPYALEQFERQASGECIVGPDMPVVRKDGSIFYADISAFHIMLHGKVYLAGIFRDITKRKQAQEALQTQALVLENMAEAVCVADQRGIIVFANPAAHAMFGYLAGELTGQHISKLNDLSPEENERFVGDLIEHLQKEGGWAGEIRNRTKGGATFFTSARINALKLPGKTLWIGVQEDITERKRATQALALQAQLLDVTMDAIIAHDLAGKIIYVNQEGARQRDYAKEEMLGKPIIDFIAPGSPREQTKARLASLHDPEAVHKFESVHLRRDGSTFPVEVRGQVTQVGDQVFYLGVVRDITERRHFENALRQSEAKYRELAENANSIILRLDTHGNITYFNEFAQTFFGYREEEIIGRNVVGTILPERDSTGVDLAGKLQDVMRHPEHYRSSENENMRRNGERVWVAWTNKAILDAQGNLSEILCVGIDRTEQRRVEKVLMKSEERYRLLADNMTDVLWMMDSNYVLTYVSPSIKKMTGYTPEEFISLGLRQIVLPDYHKLFGTSLEKLLAPEPPPFLSYQVEYRCKDKSIGWAEVTITLIRDSRGLNRGLAGVVRDITARKRAEEALRTSEANYRTLVEHSHSLILRLNPQGQIIFANTFAQEFSGYETGKIIGKPIIGTLMPAVDSDGFDLTAKIKNLMINPEPYHSSWTETIRQDGLRRWVEWNFSAIYDSEGKLLEILCIGIDRTERKWAERTLTRLSQELSRRVMARTADLEAIKSRLQQIINTTPAIIFTADIKPPHNLTFVSDYVHYLGFEPGDLVGTPLFDLDRVHPDDRSQVSLARLQAAISLETFDEDHQITVQYRVAKKDGTYSWIQGNARIERNESGAPVEIVACWIDLTRQKELEQKLEILSGPSFKLKVWKKSSKTLQALSPTLLPQSWALLQQCLQAALSGETITGVTLQLRGKNGESLLGLLTAGPVKEPKDISHKTVGVVIELKHKKTSLH